MRYGGLKVLELADVVAVVTAVCPEHAVTGPGESPQEAVFLQTLLRGLQPDPGLHPLLPAHPPHPGVLHEDVVTSSPELNTAPSRSVESNFD